MSAVLPGGESKQASLEAKTDALGGMSPEENEIICCFQTCSKSVFSSVENLGLNSQLVLRRPNK